MSRGLWLDRVVKLGENLLGLTVEELVALGKAAAFALEDHVGAARMALCWYSRTVKP